MNRTQKKDSIAGFAGKMEDAGSVVAAHYAGSTVTAMSDLRNRARKENAEVKVMKNTLARLAVKGTSLEGVTDFLKGPVVLVYSNDPVAPARIVHEASKENDKLVIVGGAMPGQALDASRVKALALLPSLDALRSRLVGLIQAPATKIAGVLQAPAGQLARVVKAYSEK
jgi:large subunit ribosomal protein L10